MAKKARKSNIPANESKAEKFKRVATARVNKAIKAVNLIGNVSGRSYEYTPEQVSKIEGLLNASVKKVMSKFRGGGEEVATVEL